jgi:hypothetical protein
MFSNAERKKKKVPWLANTSINDSDGDTKVQICTQTHAIG